MKKFLLLFTVTLSTLMLTACGVSQRQYEEVFLQKEAADVEISNLKDEYRILMSNFQLLQIENEKYAAIIEPYRELSEAEVLAKTNEANLKAEKDKKALEELEKKKAEEKAVAEKAEKEAKEKEEKQGYNTGITFEQLARTPDEYENRKVKFTGEVLQVLEGDGRVQLRLAINSDYDKVVLTEHSSSIVKSRILEDDIITIYGTSLGLYTYESALGTSITIPAINIDKIEQ